MFSIFSLLSTKTLILYLFETAVGLRRSSHNLARAIYTLCLTRIKRTKNFFKVLECSIFFYSHVTSRQSVHRNQCKTEIAKTNILEGPYFSGEVFRDCVIPIEHSGKYSILLNFLECSISLPYIRSAFCRRNNIYIVLNILHIHNNKTIYKL